MENTTVRDMLFQAFAAAQFRVTESQVSLGIRVM